MFQWRSQFRIKPLKTFKVPPDQKNIYFDLILLTGSVYQVRCLVFLLSFNKISHCAQLLNNSSNIKQSNNFVYFCSFEITMNTYNINSNIVNELIHQFFAIYFLLFPIFRSIDFSLFLSFVRCNFISGVIWFSIECFFFSLENREIDCKTITAVIRSININLLALSTDICCQCSQFIIKNVETRKCNRKWLN